MAVVAKAATKNPRKSGDPVLRVNTC